MQKIKWGIIGCGNVTEVKSGPAFNKVPGSSLEAVMRRNASKAEDYALRHGVPKWYSDVHALINDPEVDAIYIATPPLQHEEYTLLSLAAGKPVYVEKPVTLDADSAIRMKTVSEELGIKLCVAHYRRAQPMFLKIKELLDRKEIGEVRFAHLQMLQPEKTDIIAGAESNWRLNPEISGGGLFHDLAPHQLDLMVYFFGEPLSYSGLSASQSAMQHADDLVVGHVLFKNGVVFNGTWCFTVSEADKADYCEIIGSKGKIEFQVFGNKVLLSREGEEEEFVFAPIPHVEQPMIEQVTKYFSDQIEENPCSIDQAILSMKIMDCFTKK